MMLNLELYRREMRGSVKLLLIFSVIITIYVSVIISMYDPEKMKVFDGFVRAMPELMAAVGMSAGATSLIGFMASFLYGFILLVFPMVFCILRGNGLVARYVDNGSMVALVAAPVKRRTVVVTQMSVLISGILYLLIYTTLLEWICAESGFPGELDGGVLLALNGGLLCLHLFIGGICFLASCLFSSTRNSVGFGAGIPALMFVFQMLSNSGEAADKAKYFTFFTLFDPEGMIAGESGAIAGAVALLVGAVVLYLLGIVIFDRKDLHI